MRTASYRVSDLQKFTIPLGFVGENEHCQIVFLAEDVYQEYPHVAASLTVRPPYGEPYPAVVTRDGNNVVWTVKDSDLTRSGQGELQLSFTTGEIVAKTYVGKTKICRSIMPTGEVPDPIEDFLTEAGAALTAIPETIDAAFDAITAEAQTLDPGSQATAHFDGETKVLTIGVPEGEKGEPGQDGADGLDGYTPQRGVDYWTPADQAAMLQDIAQEKADAIAAIENKGTQQVGLVADEGTTQKAAVQAKGTEVIESIPSDYSELSEDVSGLKSAINSTATEETGQALLMEEERETIILTAALDNIDYLIAHLPQDSSLMDIVEELQTENDWLDMIYNEMVIKEAASA